MAPGFNSVRVPQFLAAVTTAALCLFCLTASAEVEIRNLEPKAVRAAVDQAGWTIYGGAATSADGRVSRWLWSVGRGERAGTVLLARFATHGDAQVAALNIERRGGATHVRGDAILAVVISRDPTSGAQLLGAVLRAVGGGAVSAAPMSAPIVTVDAGPDLPTIHFGRSPRPDVIAAVISLGWELASPPAVVRHEGYDAVAYSLEHPRHGVLDVTLYDCHTAATAVEITKLDKRADFASVRRGAVVVIVRGGKNVAAPVIQRLERLP